MQHLVASNAQVFENKDLLVDIFPKRSKPKVFLRQFATKHEGQNFRVYMGFLIPKYEKILPLDVNYLKIQIGFKHGCMLFYQFLDLMIKTHLKKMRFGHLDF